MDVLDLFIGVGLPLIVIAATLYHISGNIARLARALEGKKEDKPSAASVLAEHPTG